MSESITKVDYNMNVHDIVYEYDYGRYNNSLIFVRNYSEY